MLVVSHSRTLIDARPIDPDADIGDVPDRLELALQKDLGETLVSDLRSFARPMWDWGKR